MEDLSDNTADERQRKLQDILSDQDFTLWAFRSSRPVRP
jgi:hypothetical protein